MSDHQITLTTRDGHELEFTCPDGGDVISAGEAASILLPSLCKDGGCGSCLGHCAEGDYTLGSHNAGVLSEEAAARRDVLLCRTYPQSDLRITAPYDYAHIQFGRQDARRAVITGLDAIAERTVRLRLSWQDEEGGKAVEFEPGQCMELEIPDTDIRRAYSLANTGNWRGEMEFLIRLQPEGRFSTYLSRQAEVGQVLNVYGPKGAFGLQADSFNPAIFIAGGTGLAPFLSMLRRMAEWGEDRAAHLLYGVNRESELFSLDELQRLQQQLPGFTMTPCVWQPASDWPGFSGTPADALERYLADQPGDYDIYLCGPPRMVTAAAQVAVRQGIDEQRIFSENFA
jgi:ferredoxin-NADP reductase/ferredoxin